MNDERIDDLGHAAGEARDIIASLAETRAERRAVMLATLSASLESMAADARIAAATMQTTTQIDIYLRRKAEG
jgi:hypothetical protein